MASARAKKKGNDHPPTGEPRLPVAQTLRLWPPSDLLLLFVLVALTAVAYLPALRGTFIWDDDSHLTKNPCIVGPLGLKEVWTTRAARICPLVQSTFWVEHAFWGLNPLPYHLVNVLVHAACAVVLWRLLRGLGIRAAWLGAALWALHPVQVETAAWITELKNTQSCLFYLLAILFFVKSAAPRETISPRRSSLLYAASLLCGALAMASKSSTVVLPVVLGLSFWWINGRWGWRILLRLIPFFFLSLAASLLSFWTQHLEGANDPEYARSWLERIAISGKVVWFYLGKLAWPHPLIFIYPRWEINESQVISYLPTAAVGAVLLLCWRTRKGRLRPAFFAFAYFLIALFPVLGLFDHYFLRYSYVGDHFQYLASIGPLVLAGAGIATVLGFLDKGRQLATPVLGGALLMLLGAMTWRQCGMYANTETLWRETILQNPRCWMALNNLSILLLKQDRPDEVMAHIEKAIQLRPNYAEFHVTLGNALLAKQRLDDAIQQYRMALGLRFDEREASRAKAYYNLGNALLQKGQLDEAIAEYQKALQYPTENTADVHTNLANALLRKGRLDEAIFFYQKAIQSRARHGEVERAQAEYNLANALVLNGRTDDAIHCFEKALAMWPDYPEAHNNLGRVLLAKRDFANGIAHYQRAFELAPQSALYQNNLAWQLATCPDASLRNGARAVELARRASDLSGGKDPVILNTLAAAYAEERQFSKAIETAREALSLAGPEGDPGLIEALRRAVVLYEASAPYPATRP